MKAEVGDWLVIEGRRLDARRRKGVVVGLVHADGSPPFRVRWVEDGHETLVVPGPEAHIEPPPVAPDPGSPEPPG